MGLARGRRRAGTTGGRQRDLGYPTIHQHKDSSSTSRGRPGPLNSPFTLLLHHFFTNFRMDIDFLGILFAGMTKKTSDLISSKTHSSDTRRCGRHPGVFHLSGASSLHLCVSSTPHQQRNPPASSLGSLICHVAMVGMETGKCDKGQLFPH